MIVKVQRSIWPPDSDALIYDKHRTIQIQVPFTAALEKLFGPKLKIYCQAERDGDKIVINEVVPDRSW